MGNSITQGWKDKNPEFFSQNNYINRGISGQTTPQMLIRFRPDVIDLKPAAVVILAGTNDIAGNTGPSTLEMIADNIKSMAELAKANNITVILSSVLPAADYPWKPGLEPADKIIELNKMLREYALAHGIIYLDYFKFMVNDKKGLPVELSLDGVHPTLEGYKVMEPLVQEAIAEALKKSFKNKMKEWDKRTIEVHGHRGERGHLPENSIPAFLSALEKGVDVLELDVVISKDHKVVVSHEPFMSALYVQTPAGDSINKENEKSFNLYEMDYDSIRRFDIGSKGNKNFPEQMQMKTYKPLLSEMIDRVETEIAEKGLTPVKYNIEIKSVPEEYGIYQPQPAKLVDLVMQVVKDKKIENKINIQSFDPVPLNILRTKYPEIEIAYLVGEGEFEENLKALDFIPEIYSPYFGMVRDSSDVAAVHAKNMKIIPWTVNNEEDIKKMIKLKVDGIITDYPERVLEQVKPK